MHTEDAVERGRRIVLAKVGLDGHDRGIKVIARGLRDAGFHVIYGGIWQSPEAVAQAVADEDADWLGISLLNGAHMTLVPRVLEQLRAWHAEDVGVLLGGIIPEADARNLMQHGVIACFGPGSTIPQIVEKLNSRLRPSAIDITSGVDGCCQRDRRAMSRLLTRLSNGASTADLMTYRASIEKAQKSVDRSSRTIAITGSAGVGKSSLIARLIADLRAAGQTVAVLSCDPQSPITGGALLGDRLRMAASQPDDGVFIRSLATASGSQGVAENLELMLQILSLYGFDIIIVETVGTGQGDVAIRRHVDTVVLLLQPESGDSVQWEKAGILELADIVVINKSDLPGADRMKADLEEHLHLPGYHPTPVLSLSASHDQGISELREVLVKSR